MTESGAVPFFHDVEPVQRVRDDLLDVHFTGASTERRPAVIFVHGMAEDADPRPRDWDVFRGYGALAAASGLVGVTFDHRLHSGGHFPHAAADVAAVVERTRALDVAPLDRAAPQSTPHSIG